jgi:hypothetical protein
MQTLFYNDYSAARRRVYFQLFDATDGVTPEAGETGGQPELSAHGAALGNTSGVLVATSTADGLYYVELTAAELVTLGLGRHRVVYDSAATGPAEEIIEVIPHPFLHDGTLQAGGAATATLAAGASATDDIYNDGYISIIGGTGAGQVRQITDYVGSTKVATVDVAWATQPDNTSVYIIEPGSRLATIDEVWDAPVSDHAVAGSFGEYLQPIRRGTAQAGASGSITLDALASSVNDFYKGCILRIVSGTGAGQAAIISSYLGSTKVATMGQNFATTPDNTSVFVLYPLGSIPGATAPTAGDVAEAVWDEAVAAHTTDGTFGAGVLLDPTQAAIIVDQLLSRSIYGGEDGHPSVTFALAFLAGKWSDDGNGVITVYDEDDTTPIGTINYSTRVRDAIGGIDSASA